MARFENGYGSCHKIDNNKKRKNPYRVRVTDRWELDENGKAVQKFRTLGYYPTRKAGLQALADYNKNPAALGTADVTFADLFEMWKYKRDFDNMDKQAQRAYNGAFKHSAPLHNMKVCKINADNLRDIMNNVSVGVAGQKLLKTFWNQMFKYAVEKDIVHKNYANFVTTRDKDPRRSKRTPFSKEEIGLLWSNIDKVDGIDTVLIMIYTGMRPSELLGIRKDNTHLKDRYFVGGIKTNAGIDRVIPIHKRIVPLIEKRLQSTNDYLVSMNDGRSMQYRYYLEYVWKPIKNKLEFRHTPHECRHTAITLMTMAEIDERHIKMIVGHSGETVTDRYRHSNIVTLVNAIDRIEI